MAARLVAQGVCRRMVGDNEEPRGELRPRLVALSRPIDAQKNLLRQILGLLAISHQMLQHGHQPALVARHQFLERGGIVVADLEHQPDVWIQGVAAGG